MRHFVFKMVLHEIITRALFYFRNDFKEKNIEIVTEFAAAKVNILFDPQQLELVLVNIIQNAVEAIAAEGIITVKTTANPATLTIKITAKQFLLICKIDYSSLFSPQKEPCKASG